MTEAKPANGRGWSVAELEVELRRFEQELRRAALRESSIQTYVRRSQIFLRWLQATTSHAVRRTEASAGLQINCLVPRFP